MKRSLILLISMLAVLGLKQPGHTQIASETLSTVKRATALVEMPDSSGSAFCINSAGLFLTDFHVVDEGTAPQTAKLILNPGEANQLRASADVVRIDKDLDLALLQIRPPVPLTSLSLGDTQKLIETVPVIALGYPFGSDLSEHEGDYPSVTVSVGRITALRKDRGVLRDIQLDASLNPGNSGGPVVTEQGQVIGIVQSQIDGGTGINFALASNRLTPFLSAPLVTLQPPSVLPGSELKPQVFTARVLRITGPATAFSVELVLSSGPGDERPYVMKPEGAELYRVEAPLLTKLPSARVRIVATGQNGTIDSTVPDTPIQVNGQSFYLSQLSEFQGQPEPTVVFADGSHQVVGPRGMTTIRVSIAGQPVVLDPLRFDHLSFIRDASEYQQPTYRLTVRDGSQIVGQSSGSIALAAENPSPSTPPPGSLVISGPLQPATPGPSGAPITRTNPIDGAVEIFIPAGDFWMGTAEQDQAGPNDEKPRHRVYIDGYWIYRNDVTVAEYRKFCQATGHSMPSDPRWGFTGHDDHPIVNVTWDDANAYCDWAHVRLPTAAEWEKAARGTDGRLYPWGNNFEDARFWGNKDIGTGTTAPVGSFPSGASPYGALDMLGNVWQWCSDWDSGDYYRSLNDGARNPSGPGFGDRRVLRGGSWDTNYLPYFRCAARVSQPTQFKDDNTGFRCVAPR